jgi:hypothetical protein
MMNVRSHNKVDVEVEVPPCSRSHARHTTSTHSTSEGLARPDKRPPTTNPATFMELDHQ